MIVPDERTRKDWPPNGELSRWIMEQFEPGYIGYAVDVGASDGISVNSTYVLEQHRWTVLCIEPNPCFHDKLYKLRAFVMTCACDLEPGLKEFHSLNQNPEAYSALRPTYPPDSPPDHPGKHVPQWTTFPVPVRTLDQCLEDAAFPRLDALCCDTEGTDQDVLKGCDLARWKPKVIVIEAWQEGQHDEYLWDFGYRRKWRTIDNDCFVLETP